MGTGTRLYRLTATQASAITWPNSKTRARANGRVVFAQKMKQEIKKMNLQQGVKFRKLTDSYTQHHKKVVCVIAFAVASSLCTI